MTTLIHTSVDDLRASVGGPVLLPDNPGYDQARTVWNPVIDRHPALIVRALTADDVAAAVRFARNADLEISVRGGGHSSAGWAVADGALMLDLSLMKTLSIDPAARTATAGPGLLWGEFDTATQAFGLATTGGVVSTTGIAGLTLGGGIGYLDRLHGLTCDNLLGAELVTADGTRLTVDDHQHPDLFWALRGGGGNFGVVTRFHYRLHPVGPPVIGGILLYRGEQGADVLTAFHELATEAPRCVALSASLMTAPPAPFVPDTMRGTPAVAVVPVCFGNPDDAAPLLSALRALRPSVDLIQVMPYSEAQRQIERYAPSEAHHYYNGRWLRELDRPTIAALLDAAADSPSPLSLTAIKRMGGATADLPAGATAFGGRAAAYNLDVHAMWPPHMAARPNIDWTHRMRQAAQGAAAGGSYLNFFDRGQHPDRVQQAFGENYPRLVRIKRAYDPDNVFHLNANIPPWPDDGRAHRAG